MSLAGGQRGSIHRNHYHPVAKFLHWIIAAMIVLQFVLARLAENAATPLQELALLANHKSVGITIFLCAVIRLSWRLRQGTPPPLPMPGWQIIASRISHWTMYGIILLMPISGWLMSSASAYSVSWFSLVPLPDLVAADPSLKETLEGIHETLAKLLFFVATIHIAAALKHSLINKDGAIARISSAAATIMFVVIIALGVLTLTRVGDGEGYVLISDAQPGSNIVETDATELDAWNIDYESSYIRFTAIQAGADIEGDWQEWHADIRFDEARLDASLFDVGVLVESVETLDDDRDRTLQDIEWFDAENYPEVQYHASRFVKSADGGFEARGNLVVKGRSTPITLKFTALQTDGNYVLDGEAELNRMRLHLGIGEWSDTRWIGQLVAVVVHVETIE